LGAENADESLNTAWIRAQATVAQPCGPGFFERYRIDGLSPALDPIIALYDGKPPRQILMAPTPRARGVIPNGMICALIRCAERRPAGIAPRGTA